MKLDEGDVKEMVEECRQERFKYCQAAEHWENIWRMEPYEETSARAGRELDGVERVRLADGYNIVQLASRFISSDIRIEIPYISATDLDDERSTLMEEWATSFWMRAGRQLGQSIPNSMSWQSLVRGRGAMQVLWVEDLLPSKLKGQRLPILPRMLDPMNVGSRQGPYYTDYAYHEYDAKPSYVRQMYPDFKVEEEDRLGRRKVYKLVDFWYRGNAGEVWHCVTVDGKFAKAPKKTSYPEIPIIEWTGDSAPIADFEYQSLSILHPLKDLYKLKCDLSSGIMTALWYYFNPLMVTRGVNEDIEIGPGAIVRLPDANASIEPVRMDPNISLSETMISLVDQQIQQATFPSVMYGENMGGASGYAINQLGQAARGRIATVRENQESALERATELIFQLVEIFGDDSGVLIWGKSAFENRGKPLVLRGRDIKGNYANEVRLVPEIPMDDTQRITTWLQLYNAGIISAQTMRDKIINVATPRDEDLRVTVEQIMKTPEMSNKKALRAVQSWYKSREDWELLIQGTPLEQVYQAEQQVLEQKAAEKEQARQARREERQMRDMMQGLPPDALAMMGQGMMPPPPDMGGGMPGEMPPSGAPPGMPPGMPPEMPSMMQPGMGGPGMGMPPDLGGVMGAPPEMQGGMTPEMLGLPPDAAPGMFQQMTGQPLSEAEMQRRMLEDMGGLPPEGMM